MNRGASRNVIVSIELLAFDNLIRNIHFSIWNNICCLFNFLWTFRDTHILVGYHKKLLHPAIVCHDEILFHKMLLISKNKISFYDSKGICHKKK